MGGFLIHEWPVGPADDRGYTPEGKPAEGVLRAASARPAWMAG